MHAFRSHKFASLLVLSAIALSGCTKKAKEACVDYHNLVEANCSKPNDDIFNCEEEPTPADRDYLECLIDWAEEGCSVVPECFKEKNEPSVEEDSEEESEEEKDE